VYVAVKRAQTVAPIVLFRHRKKHARATHRLERSTESTDLYVSVRTLLVAGERVVVHLMVNALNSRLIHCAQRVNHRNRVWHMLADSFFRVVVEPQKNVRVRTTALK